MLPRRPLGMNSTRACHGPSGGAPTALSGLMLSSSAIAVISDVFARSQETGTRNCLAAITSRAHDQRPVLSLRTGNRSPPS